MRKEIKKKQNRTVINRMEIRIKWNGYQSLFKVLFGKQCTQMFNGRKFSKVITAPNLEELFLNVSL